MCGSDGKTHSNEVRFFYNFDWLTQFWVLSQAKITVVWPFGKTEKIHKMTTVRPQNGHDPNVSTTPLWQWGFRQCLPFSWTTLRGKLCRHPIAVMGVVDTFGPCMSSCRIWMTILYIPYLRPYDFPLYFFNSLFQMAVRLILQPVYVTDYSILPFKKNTVFIWEWLIFKNNDGNSEIY